MSTILPTLKHKNITPIFTKQVFVNMSQNNIIQADF